MAGRKRFIILRKVVRKIPRFVWGTFAVLGIFIVGFVLGVRIQSEYQSDNNTTDQNEKMGKYQDVLNTYQGISRLIFLQQQDMDIITDSSKWQEDPQELTDAIQSYKQEKDEMLFQWGRLYELRRKAGLPEDPNIKAE